MPIVRAAARLTRLDSSLLIFLAVFVPIVTRTRDLPTSLERAIPFLFIAMCTYVANDLSDVERDRINHPTRPLPSGALSRAGAVTLFFLCLGAALLTTWAYAAPGVAFGYYALLALAISYGFIVDALPSLKAPYVAAALAIPILIVAAYFPGDTRLFFAAASVFFLNLGRELLKDLVDRPGDPESVMHRIPPARIAIIAFVMQAIGLVPLVALAGSAIAAAVLFLMACVLVAAGTFWFRLAARQKAIFLMKLQLFVGLYFLA